MKNMKKSIALLALALGITTAGVVATKTERITQNDGLVGTYDFVTYAENLETPYELIGLVSTDGAHLLLLTSIDDVTAYKEVGYDVSVNGGVANRTMTETYYTSLKTKTGNLSATELFEREVDGMIVQEIEYNHANSYSVTPVLIRNDGTHVEVEPGVSDTFDETAVQTTKETYDLQKYVDGSEIKSKAGKVNLSVTGIPADYNLTAIKYEQTDVMTEGKLDLAKMPITAYGDVAVTATYTSTNGKFTHDVEVPVTAVTATFTTKAEFDTLGQLSKATEESENLWGGYFKLGADITYNGFFKSFINNGAKTVGVNDNKGTYGFKGVFDGQGYTVDKMCVYNGTDNSYQAFISALAGGTVKNVAFKNAEFGVGGYVTSWGIGTVENVYVQISKMGVTASGDAYTAYIWGQTGVFSSITHNITVKNCTVDVSKESFAFANSTAIANMQAESKGYLLGQTDSNEQYFHNNMIIGAPEWAKVSRCWTNRANGVQDNTLTTGAVKDGWTAYDTVPNTLNLGLTVSEGTVGGTAQYTVNAMGENETLVNVKLGSKTITGATLTGKTLSFASAQVAEKVGTQMLYVETNVNTYVVMVNVVSKTVATQDDFFAIGAISDALNGGGYYQLTNNINLSKKVFNTSYVVDSFVILDDGQDYRIGVNKAFTGTIDGNGYKVNGLRVGGIWNDSGWIQNVAGGTVKNLALTNMNMSGNGCIVAKGYGNFENLYLQYSTLYGATKDTALDTNGGYSWFGNSTGGLIWSTSNSSASVWSNIVFDYTATYEVMAKMLDKRFGNVNIGVLGQTTSKVTYTNVAVVGISANFVNFKRIFNLTNDGSAQGVYVQCGDADNTTNGVANNLANMNANYFNYADGVISWKTK